MSHQTISIAAGALQGDGSVKPALSDITGAPAANSMAIFDGSQWAAAPAPSGEALGYSVVQPSFIDYAWASVTASQRYYNTTGSRLRKTWYKAAGVLKRSTIADLDASLATQAISAAYGSSWTSTLRFSEAGVWLIVANFNFAPNSSSFSSDFQLRGAGIAGPQMIVGGGTGRRTCTYVHVFETSSSTNDVYLYMTARPGNTQWVAPGGLPVLTIQITKIG